MTNVMHTNLESLHQHINPVYSLVNLWTFCPTPFLETCALQGPELGYKCLAEGAADLLPHCVVCRETTGPPKVEMQNNHCFYCQFP